MSNLFAAAFGCCYCLFCVQFPYICAVVSEALRLYPPGASTLRETAQEPFQLGPYSLPSQSTIVVSTYVIQRDPEVWPEAAAFKPERWLPVSRCCCVAVVHNVVCIGNFFSPLRILRAVITCNHRLHCQSLCQR